MASETFEFTFHDGNSLVNAILNQISGPSITAFDLHTYANALNSVYNLFPQEFQEQALTLSTVLLDLSNYLRVKQTPRLQITPGDANVESFLQGFLREVYSSDTFENSTLPPKREEFEKLVYGLDSYNKMLSEGSEGSQGYIKENPKWLATSALLKRFDDMMDSTIRGLFPMRTDHFKELYSSEHGKDFKRLIDDYERQHEIDEFKIKQAIADLSQLIAAAPNDMTKEYTMKELQAHLDAYRVPLTISNQQPTTPSPQKLPEEPPKQEEPEEQKEPTPPLEKAEEPTPPTEKAEEPPKVSQNPEYEKYNRIQGTLTELLDKLQKGSSTDKLTEDIVSDIDNIIAQLKEVDVKQTGGSSHAVKFFNLLQPGLVTGPVTSASIKDGAILEMQMLQLLSTLFQQQQLDALRQGKTSNFDVLVSTSANGDLLNALKNMDDEKLKGLTNVTSLPQLFVIELIISLLESSAEEEGKAIAVKLKAAQNRDDMSEDDKAIIELVQGVVKSFLSKVSSAPGQGAQEELKRLSETLNQLQTFLQSANEDNMEILQNKMLQWNSDSALASLYAAIIALRSNPSNVTNLPADAQKTVDFLSALPASITLNALNALYSTLSSQELDKLKAEVEALKTNQTAPSVANADLYQQLQEMLTNVTGLVDNEAIADKLANNEDFKQFIASKLEQITKSKMDELEKTKGDIQAMISRGNEIDAITSRLAKSVDTIGTAIGTKQNVESVGMKGGSAQEEIDKAKKVRVNLDNGKKMIRSTIDTINALYKRFDKLSNVIDKGIELGNEKASNVDYSTVSGYYKTLSDDGKQVLDDAKQILSESKDTVKKVYDVIQKIYDSDPNDKVYIAQADKLKKLMEGDFDAADTSDDITKRGLINLIEGLPGQMRTEFDEAYTNVKRLYSGLKEQKEEDVKLEQARNASNRLNPLNLFKGGGKDAKESFDEVMKTTEKVYSDFIKPLDAKFKLKANSAFATVTNGEPSMFSQLYNQYLDRKVSASATEAISELSNGLRANNLVPREVLRVNTMDKVIFVFVTLFTRLFALSLVSYLIETGRIVKLNWALVLYLIAYTVIIAAFTVLVNVDIYRLRIIFNYVNLHSNRSLLLTHFALLYLFSFLIFLIIWNINTPLSEGVRVDAITDEQKASLIQRLEILSMLTWLFLVLMIAIL